MAGDIVSAILVSIIAVLVGVFLGVPCWDWWEEHWDEMPLANKNKEMADSHFDK